MEKTGREGLQRGQEKPLGMMAMFTLLIVVMVSWGYIHIYMYVYITTYQTVYFKYVQFTTCQFCCNKAV